MNRSKRIVVSANLWIDPKTEHVRLSSLDNKWHLRVDPKRQPKTDATLRQILEEANQS
jgi:hypothetical protein